MSPARGDHRQQTTSRYLVLATADQHGAGRGDRHGGHPAVLGSGERKVAAHVADSTGTGGEFGAAAECH
jgi:hypothetical protein